MLKQSVKLRRYVFWGGVAARCHTTAKYIKYINTKYSESVGE
jgi:hypothetical protein